MATALKIRPALRNLNRGTERGEEIVAHSIETDGVGRSIVLAADGEAIAGSHVLEIAEEKSIPIREVHVNGTELIALVRDDIPNAQTERAIRLAVADNMGSLRGFAWDAPVLQEYEVAGVEFGPLLFPGEIDAVMEEFAKEQKAEEEELKKPVKVKSPTHSTLMARVTIETKARWQNLLEEQNGDTLEEKILEVIEKAERYQGLL